MANFPSIAKVTETQVRSMPEAKIKVYKYRLEDSHSAKVEKRSLIAAATITRYRRLNSQCSLN